VFHILNYKAGGFYPPFFYAHDNHKEATIIRIRKGKAKTKEVVPKERINRQITVDQVRLIDADGQQVGIVKTNEAIKMAEKAELDLVEISPTAEPPVCRIMDFSKYYYQKEKKVKEARKKQHEVQVKEIKFGPSTEEHDYNFKKNNATRFLKQHNKVKFTVKFRGRQMAHKELGYSILERLAADLADIADVDSQPLAEKNLLMMIISPKKDIDKILSKMEPKETQEPTIVELEQETAKPVVIEEKPVPAKAKAKTTKAKTETTEKPVETLKSETKTTKKKAEKKDIDPHEA
jgi:translation initiation factor IF-3